MENRDHLDGALMITWGDWEPDDHPTVLLTVRGKDHDLRKSDLIAIATSLLEAAKSLDDALGGAE